MYSQETVLELVDLTYAAACDPARWPQMLESLCTAIGAAGANLGVVNLARASAQFRAGVGIIDAEFMTEYDHHLQHEPFLMAANKGVAARNGGGQ